MTEREIRVAQSIAAIEAASRIYEGKGTITMSSVTSAASQVLRWLEENS
jgi:hypothetical protein